MKVIATRVIVVSNDSVSRESVGILPSKMYVLTCTVEEMDELGIRNLGFFSNGNITKTIVYTMTRESAVQTFLDERSVATVSYGCGVNDWSDLLGLVIVEGYNPSRIYLIQ